MVIYKLYPHSTPLFHKILTVCNFTVNPVSYPVLSPHGCSMFQIANIPNYIPYPLNPIAPTITSHVISQWYPVKLDKLSYCINLYHTSLICTSQNTPTKCFISNYLFIISPQQKDIWKKYWSVNEQWSPHVKHLRDVGRMFSKNWWDYDGDIVGYTTSFSSLAWESLMKWQSYGHFDKRSLANSHGYWTWPFRVGLPIKNGHY